MVSAPAGALWLLLFLAAFAGSTLAQLPPEAAPPAPDRARRSDWVVTPSLRLAETYTDNVFLSPDGFQQSDWITQVVPGLSVRGNGPRLRLDASYAPEIVYHAETNREDKVFHRGNALGTLEIADKLAFVEAGARIDQYDVSAQQPLTTSNVNITGNRSTVATTYVSPYLLRDIGSAARAEARFTYSTWNSDDNQRALPDNTAQRVNLRLTNGAARGLLTWDVGYSGEKIRYETQQQTTTEQFTASAQRRITGAVSLLALAGYERYDTGIETLAEPRWSAGLEWSPSPRTRLALTAGRRLDDDTYSFQFNHRTRLTTWNLSYAEEVTTSRGQFFVPATQSTAGTLDQMLLTQYPDPAARQRALQDLLARTGLPPALGSPINFFTDQLFLQKRWLASVGLQGSRNTLVATASWEQRKDLAAGTASPLDDFALSQSIRTSGLSLAWALRLTARTTWNFDVGRQRSEFLDTGQTDDFAYLRAGLSRQLQPHVSGSLYYRLHARDGNQGAAAQYRENAGVASLLITF